MATRDRPTTQTDLVRMYIDLIEEEKRRLNECFANIQEYAMKLHEATADAQQRLLAGPKR